MSIASQPASYSEMLEKIFTCTRLIGLACTILLCAGSTTFAGWMDAATAIAAPASAGLWDLRALLTTLPFLLALASRIVVLHDRVSDVFRIRERFDVDHILVPLSTRVGFEVEEPFRRRLREKRDKVMRQAFYKYASFVEPQIPVQLVRTAADNWAWYWVAVEGLVFVVPTAGFLLFSRSWVCGGIALALAACLSGVLVLKHFRCRASILPQLDEILEDSDRKFSIYEVFRELAIS